MINHERYFATTPDTAAFLASVCTCFTCPVKAGTTEGGMCEGSCEDAISAWLEEVTEDEQ